jgi:hypothetical protein
VRKREREYISGDGVYGMTSFDVCTTGHLQQFRLQRLLARAAKRHTFVMVRRHQRTSRCPSVEHVVLGRGKILLDGRLPSQQVIGNPNLSKSGIHVAGGTETYLRREKAAIQLPDTWVLLGTC